MAKYPAMITTNKGRDLVSKSNATGKAINWTRIALGEGQNTGNIYTMIDIVDKKIDIVINKATDLTNGKWKIQGDINNEQLDTGFFCREIGVFAKCEGDDNEVLFAYTNGGNYVDYIPDKTTHVDTKKVTCMFAVGDAEYINIINNDEAFLRKEDLNEHNSDPNAHGGLITKVQSELTRHNTDISSHPPITAMIAKILGATDWQENPAATLKDIKNNLGMGGIVAQRLEETGFVKFANGFTIQWGVSGEDGKDHAWAIPYSTCFYVNAMFAEPQNRNWFLTVKGTALNFKIYLQNDNIFDRPDVICKVISVGVAA